MEKFLLTSVPTDIIIINVFSKAKCLEKHQILYKVPNMRPDYPFILFLRNLYLTFHTLIAFKKNQSLELK